MSENRRKPKKQKQRLHCQNAREKNIRHDIHVDKLGLVCLISFTVSLTFQLNLHVIGGMELRFLQTEWPNINQPECIIITLRQNATDGLSKCLFPVLLINRNSMRAASCLPLKNMTYLDDVKTWKFFVTFGNLSKTTGIG